jgi:hypothetical protein
MDEEARSEHSDVEDEANEDLELGDDDAEQVTGGTDDKSLWNWRKI